MNGLLRLRAWHKQERRMYYFTLGDLVGFDDETVYLRDVFYGNHASERAWSLACGSDGSWVNPDVELMQSIQMQDTHGKEIYEGDILRYEGIDGRHRGVVSYSDGRYFPHVVYSQAEIVGNICESPEADIADYWTLPGAQQERIHAHIVSPDNSTEEQPGSEEVPA